MHKDNKRDVPIARMNDKRESGTLVAGPRQSLKRDAQNINADATLYLYSRASRIRKQMFRATMTPNNPCILGDAIIGR